ncbi:MAG: tetratricopeptide repeat protein, partial [Gemmatimonadota bacterium]
ETLGRSGPGGPPAGRMDRLAEERDNFRGALAWAVDAGDADVGLALAAALWRFWEARGHLTHGRKWLSAVLALPGGSDAARAGALCGAGVLARYQGEVRESRTRLTEAEALWREVGQTREWAETLTYLAMAEHYVADFDSARAHFDEALAYWRGAGDPEGLARALAMRAGMANHEGDQDTAEAMRRESLDLWRALDDEEGVGQALLGLGEVARCRGDLDSARDRCREALAVFREVGDLYHQGATLHNLGYIERRRGELDEARRFFDASLDVLERTGHRLGVASCAVGLAGVRLDVGEPREAALLLGAAERRQRELGISIVRADRGQWDEIRAGIRRALGDAAFEKAVTAGAALPLDALLQDARTAAATPPDPSDVGDRENAGVVHAAHDAAGARSHAPGRHEALTDRQVEVLRLLAEGLTYAEIGRRLFISARTVDAHLRSAYAKLDVHSRHGAVRAARRAGVIPPPPRVP